MALLTAPWSILAIAVGSAPSLAPWREMLRPVTSTAGTFVIFAGVCGGLNAVLIFALMSAFQLRKQRHS
jgi:hypothetical protein